MRYRRRGEVESGFGAVDKRRWVGRRESFYILLNVLLEGNIKEKDIVKEFANKEFANKELANKDEPSKNKL